MKKVETTLVRVFSQYKVGETIHFKDAAGIEYELTVTKIMPARRTRNDSAYR